MSDGPGRTDVCSPSPPCPLGACPRAERREGAGVRAWVRDAAQILVVDECRERVWSLRGVEAAIWDLLVLGYSLERMVDFLSVLQETPQQEAHAVLLQLLRKWEQEGILPSPRARGAGGEGVVGG